MIVEQTGQEKEEADNKGKRGENKESHSLHLEALFNPLIIARFPLIHIVLGRQKWTNIIKLPGRMYCTTTKTRGILKGKN